MANILLIIGITIAVLQAYVRGYIKSVESAGLILIITTFLIAARLPNIAKLIAVAIPFYFFGKQIGLVKASDYFSLMILISPLVIMMLGYYVMFRGIFPKKKK